MSRSRNLKPKAYHLHSSNSSPRFSEKEMNNIYINYSLLLKMYNHNKAEATRKIATAPLWALQEAKKKHAKTSQIRVWLPLHIKAFFTKVVRSDYSIVNE